MTGIVEGRFSVRSAAAVTLGTAIAEMSDEAVTTMVLLIVLVSTNAVVLSTTHPVSGFTQPLADIV